MTVATVVFWVVLPLFSVAIVLAFVRLLRGPTLPDRVVALDLLITLGIGIATAYGVAYRVRMMLDVAILLALSVFLSTIAFARYLEKGVD